MIGIWIDTRALGDTIAAIPACKKIAAAYPGEHIILFTSRPELFEGHQWFSQAYEYDAGVASQCTRVHRLFSPLVGKSYQLEGGETIEWRYSNMDIRQFHAVSQGFTLDSQDMETDLFIEHQRELDVNNYVIIHPTYTWASRTWDVAKWQELCDRLAEARIPVVAVGRSGKEQGFFEIDKPVMDLNIKYGVNLLDDPDNDVAELRYMMNRSAKCVVTMDSGILHVAGTTDVNIIQLGSSIDWKLRAPWRKGSQDYKYKYVGGGCNLACSSNMKYNVQVHGSIHGVPPQVYCLENKPTFECHPNVDQVFNSVLKLYEGEQLLQVDSDRICVTTIYNEAYAEMAETTAFNNFKKYCQIHGYKLEAIKIEDGERTPHWHKITEVKKLLQSGKYDWVFFMDLDCLFMNTAIKLESLMSPVHFLTIGNHDDVPDTPVENGIGQGLMTAQFLIKACPESIAFLDDVWACKETKDKMLKFDYEMRQFRVSAAKPEFKEGINIVDERQLNTFWWMTNPHMLHHFPNTNDLAWKPDDFIVHVPAGVGENRLQTLKDLNYFSGGALVTQRIEDGAIVLEPLYDLQDVTIKTWSLNGTPYINWKFDEMKVKVGYQLWLNEIKNNILLKAYNKHGELISAQVFY